LNAVIGNTICQGVQRMGAANQMKSIMGKVNLDWMTNWI